MTDVLRVDAAPQLVGLFAAAVVNGRSAGRELPDVVAERSEVVVTPEAVADYARLCGFGVGAHPPLTWPHILGFPLQAALMSRRDFPLPMVGLVHVENKIEWSRPFAYGEIVDVRVHAEGVRPHRRGRLVDVVASVTAGDEQVWRGTSTYLSRGLGDESVPSVDPPDVAGLRDRATVVLRFGADAGRRYAAVSGDVNPIHLSALTAKALGCPRAIAHGMFSYARVLASLGPRVPDAGSSTVWFRKPILLPSTTALGVAPAGDLAALFPRRGDGPGEGEHLVCTTSNLT